MFHCAPCIPQAEWENPETSLAPSWPEEGEVTFSGYSTRYRPGADLVIRDVTITIRPGEKVNDVAAFLCKIPSYHSLQAIPI